jgi:hypothetical protein
LLVGSINRLINELTNELVTKRGEMWNKHGRLWNEKFLHIISRQLNQFEKTYIWDGYFALTLSHYMHIVILVNIFNWVK